MESKCESCHACSQPVILDGCTPMCMMLPTLHVNQNADDDDDDDNICTGLVTSLGGTMSHSSLKEALKGDHFV